MAERRSSSSQRRPLVRQKLQLTGDTLTPAVGASSRNAFPVDRSPTKRETSTAAAGISSRHAGRRPTKPTHEDQNKTDKEKQQEALLKLVEIWLQRLQLISVITTFFASTEAGFLGRTVPATSNTPLSAAAQATNVIFTGALIIHTNAAIISFLGAFFLVQYKLEAAEKAEDEIEHHVNSPTPISWNDMEKTYSPTSPYVDDLWSDHIRRRGRVNPPLTGDEIIWPFNVQLVQVGPFHRPPRTLLLSRCHSLCVFLAFTGFILALIGIMIYVWDRLPPNAGIFSSFCMALCLVLSVLIVIVPSTKTSHIYYNHK